MHYDLKCGDVAQQHSTCLEGIIYKAPETPLLPLPAGSLKTFPGFDARDLGVHYQQRKLLS